MPETLGQANVTATLGGAGSSNPGKWLAVFDSNAIGVSLPEFECYHMIIDAGPAGSTARITLGVRLWDTVFPGNDTSWDPNQPLPLVQGDTVTFSWNSAATPAPDVWMYFRERSPL